MTENDLKELLQIKTESKNLDFKQTLNWDTCDTEDKVNLVKHILAMANTQDGGKIIFGVKDGDYEPIGMPEEDFTSFDITKINDFLEQYSDPKCSCQVFKLKLESKNFVVIDIPEFTTEPIICKKDANSKNGRTVILKNGGLYVRTEKGSSQLIPSSQEMRELLGRALIKKRDELLHNIEALLSGRPQKPKDESKTKFEEEIKQAEEYLKTNLQIEKHTNRQNFWNLAVYPLPYQPNRVPDQNEIRKLIDQSAVKLRGWYFPYTNTHENTSNFTKGRQTFLVGGNHIEGYHALQSGLFYWKKVFWEAIDGQTTRNGRSVLSFIGAIYTLTEIFFFLKRYYEFLSPDTNLYIRITLTGLRKRKLVSSDPSALLFDLGDYISQENTFVEETSITSVMLKASWKEQANEVARKLFLIFNCNDLDPAEIGNWQTKLMERRF